MTKAELEFALRERELEIAALRRESARAIAAANKLERDLARILRKPYRPLAPPVDTGWRP